MSWRPASRRNCLAHLVITSCPSLANDNISRSCDDIPVVSLICGPLTIEVEMYCIRVVHKGYVMPDIDPSSKPIDIQSFIMPFRNYSATN